MELVSILILIVIWWGTSYTIERRGRQARHEFVGALSDRLQETLRLQSQIEAGFKRMPDLRARERRHRPIDMENLVLVDRSVVYTKKSIETYYEVKSGRVVALSGPESMLMISKAEISSRELQDLIASRTPRPLPDKSKSSRTEKNVSRFL